MSSSLGILLSKTSIWLSSYKKKNLVVKTKPNFQFGPIRLGPNQSEMCPHSTTFRPASIISRATNATLRGHMPSGHRHSVLYIPENTPAALRKSFKTPTQLNPCLFVIID